MDKREFVKSLVDYFTEITWDEPKKKKVNSLVDKLLDSYTPQPIIKKVYVERVRNHRLFHYREMAENIKAIALKEDMDSIAETVCARYSMIKEQLYTKSSSSFYGKKGRRHDVFVYARQDFCIQVKHKFPKTPLILIGDYLGYKDHTSVIHLLKYKKLVDSPEYVTINEAPISEEEVNSGIFKKSKP